jgi:hypothetical protein
LAGTRPVRLRDAEPRDQQRQADGDDEQRDESIGERKTLAVSDDPGGHFKWRHNEAH